MAPDQSVTDWLHQLREGDSSAASRLWGHYFQRMQLLARKAVPSEVARGVYDEEDVALSAFAHFCLAMQDGRYDELRDRNELWNLLATFTLNKARVRTRHARTQKRGGGVIVATLDNSDSGAHGLDDLPGSDRAADWLALMGEQCQYLMSLLDDSELESVALWRLEGYTNDEIASKLGCTQRTVKRMLALIRSRWEQEQS